MEENNSIKKGINNEIDTKNLKPFLSVIVVLIIILIGYYFIWRSITYKTKKIISEKISQYFTVDSISAGGFPFKKKITISNILIDKDKLPYMSDKEIVINDITISSLIFSSNLNINFKDIILKYYKDDIEIEKYSLVYDKDKKPTINISVYPTLSKIKSFNYIDNGYKMINADGEERYSVDSVSIKINSVYEKNTINYAILFDIINSNPSYDNTIIDNDFFGKKYSTNSDISYSITLDEGDFDNSIIKINNFKMLSEDKKNGFSILGELQRDTGDNKTFGTLKIILYNYSDFMKNIEKETIKALKIDNIKNSLNAQEQKEYEKITKNLFSVFNRLIYSNKETTKTQGVFEINRAKNSYDYIINGKNFLDIYQQIINE